MQLTGGEIVAESLIRAGIPYAVGVPGHGILGLLDACVDREDRLRCIGMKQEAAAVHLADGYFRATGSPLAVFTSLGPGALNTAAALATSYVDSTAVLCITGAPPTYMVGKGVQQEIARGRRGHAAPDVVAPVVKRQWCIARPEQLVTVMERAVTEMLTGRFGPVHIDLPMDLQATGCEVDLPDRIAAPKAWTTPPAGGIDRAVTLLRAAERPVILAGGGVLTGGASAALRALAEATGAAVATTGQGKSGFPEDHPLSLGVVGTCGTAVAAEFCAQADVLLAVGCRFTDATASSYRQGVSFAIPPTQLIQIDVDPREIGKNYPVTLGLIGDARRTLHAIHEAFMAAGPAVAYAQAEYTQAVAQTRAAWEAQLAAARDDDAEPATISAVLAEVREFLDDDAFVVSSAGATQAQVLQEFPFTVPGTHITAGGFAPPGFALPAALGVKLGRPERQVLGICGDGAFLQSMPELATAVEYDIPVVLLVCNTGGWQQLRALQTRLFGAERAKLTEFGTQDGEARAVRVADLAEAVGCHAQRVSSPEEIQTALAAAFASDRTAVIECVVAREAPALPQVGWWDLPVPAYLTEQRAEYDQARAEQQL